MAPAAACVAAICLVAAIGGEPPRGRDLHLVKWKKTGTCEIVSTLPLFGDHWTEIGIYPTPFQARRALEQARRLRICPPPPPP